MVNIATRVPPLVNRGVLPHEVQIFTNFGGSQAMVLMVDLAMTVADLKMLFMNTPAVRRVLYNIEGFNPDKIKFYISDRTLALEEHLPLLIYNVAANDSIRSVYHRVGGMAKKGVKKISKDERLHTLRAKLHYMFAQDRQASPNIQAICNNIALPGYVATTIANMNMPQITRLDGIAHECNRSDKLIKALVHSLVPNYQVLLDQKTAIENSMKSIEDAFEVGITDAYFNGARGINTDPIYDAIETRLNELTEEDAAERRRADMEAEVARRTAAAAAAPAADMEL
jgi:hypothetical protein